jgi:hypothetical protein
MNDEARKFLDVNEVDEMMIDGEQVHTFVSASFGPLGCDMSRSKLLSLAGKNKAELSGVGATGLGHGVTVWDDNDQPIFCQTAIL